MADITNGSATVTRVYRPPPSQATGAIGWMRRNLFNSVLNSIITILLVLVIGMIVWNFLDWAVFKSVTSAKSGQECGKISPDGACWAFVVDKYRLIFFGTYPYEEQWRPLFACISVIAMLVLSCDRRFWNAWLAAIWGIGSIVTFLLMFGQIFVPLSVLLIVALVAGGIGLLLRRRAASAIEVVAYWVLATVGAVGLAVLLWDWVMGLIGAPDLMVRLSAFVPGFTIAPLSYVETSKWGGLPVTLILASYGLAFAFPLGILAALGRRSKLPLIKGLCVGYIELIRGVPLISLLIMASVMLPLFLPTGMTIDKFLRALVAVTLFAGAYIAEIIRGGLQSIPKGQYEAADAMGLSYMQKTAFIILPQALQVVIPPLVNTFIGFFKDTSLVLIIGIFDLLNAGEQAIVDRVWSGYANEIHVFLAIIYFCMCYSMSRYSKYLEREMNKSVRR